MCTASDHHLLHIFSGRQSCWAQQQEENLLHWEFGSKSKKLLRLCWGNLIGQKSPKTQQFFSCTLEHFLPVFVCKKAYFLQLFSGSSKKEKLLHPFASQRYIVGRACKSSASDHSNQPQIQRLLCAVWHLVMQHIMELSCRSLPVLAIVDLWDAGAQN